MKYLFALFLSFVLFSCTEPCNVPLERVAEPIDTTKVEMDTSFLPLQVGNEWTYVNTAVDTIDVCRTMISKTVIVEDSLTFFEMVDSFSSKYKEIILLRYRNPREIEAYVGGKRMLYLSLDSLVWQDPTLNSKIYREKRTEDVSTPAGEFLRCTVFGFGEGEPWTQSYFPGVGMIEHSGLGSWHLKSAIVGGKKIGVW